MARDPPLLSSTVPTAIVPAPVHIGHVQLRDLIICPRERGIVNYVKHQSIVEHNLNASDSGPRTLADLTFTPNTLTSLQLGDTNNTLIAAGGQDAEIYLSLHTAPNASRQRHSHALWQFETNLPGSINNSVLLTSLSLSRSNESSIEPRVGISNNDCTVKFYDVPIRGQSAPKKIKESGALRLDVPVNHSSISPDGRTLLSVGDSPKVYLHRLTGGAQVTFTPISTLALPPPDSCPINYSSSSLAASFSTSFSSNGTKFAVASQEGVVVVWDVRSTKPLKIFQTDKTRVPGGKAGNGSATGWLSDDPWDWTRGNSKAPGWSVRSVKFGNGGESGRSGKELMTFTEHTSLLHVVDARTFETEEIVRVPSFAGRTSPQPPPTRQPPPPSASRPRSISPAYVPMSPVSRAPRIQSPAPPMIVLALEDTFRISSSPPRTTDGASPSSRWRALRRRARADDEVVVIPPLGDREVEDDVQALLGRHGIRARQHSEDAYDVDREQDHERERERNRDEYELLYPGTLTGSMRLGDEEMEIDELESDCVSSHTPSRSSSPSPSTHIPVQASPARNSLSPSQNIIRFPRRRAQTRDEVEYGEDSDSDLDLAGTCFDPTGGYVYVASTSGVAEWSVRGAEKKWWFDNTWV